MTLDEGVTLIQGANGHGKSNLLEAAHMLSVARSTRASTEIELVRSGSLDQHPIHAQAAGVVETPRGQLRLQIDFMESPGRAGDPLTAPDGSSLRPPGIQKALRVNGVRRRSAEFVGRLKAVQFTPEDLELTGGRPPVRRRFMDLLISQLSHRYLTEWQEYSRIMRQRNHLLRAIRDGGSSRSELEFWDIQFAVGAGRIMSDRRNFLGRLSEVAGPVHRELTGLQEPLVLTYVPSAAVGDAEDARDLANAVLEEIRARTPQEIAAGHSLVGPHRDDLLASIGDVDVASFASRGQARTVVLAVKLAEAQLITQAIGDQPVLLLDDVMSELDPERQRHVLEFASNLQQVIVTTAEPGLADNLGIDRSRTLSVEDGRITPTGLRHQ